MMTRSEIVVALGALAVAVLTAGCQTTPGAEPLRVATYNIRLQCGKPGSPDCWEERRDELVRTIRNMNLDAFGLQEVCPGQMAYLKEKLPEFAFVGDHREKDRKTGEASPVAYRKTRFDAEKSGTFWLSETPDVPASKSWGTCCTRVCSYLVLRDKTSGRRLCFANTHTDHISAEAREKGMMLIIDKMKAFGAGYPIVFVGDHNCRENETPAQHVATRLANALYLTETPPEGGWRTWNGWRWREKEVSAREALALSVEKRNESRKATVRGKAAKVSDVLDDTFYEKCGGPRIDYIYVTPGTRVLDYRTVNDVRSDRKMYPSDHFPVVATIVLP